MSYYNITNVTAATDFNSFATGVNGIVDGGLGISILVLISVLVMLALMLRNYSIGSAFGVSSFVTAIISYFMRAIGLIQDSMFLVFLIIAVAGMTMMYFSSKSG